MTFPFVSVAGNTFTGSTDLAADSGVSRCPQKNYRSDLNENAFYAVSSWNGRAICARFLSSILLVVFLASAIPGAAQPPRAKQKRPNILLIVLDTVRYDAVSPANTPFLDSLARRGVAFTGAWATHDFTPTSHFSMMTGFRDGLGGDADRVENGIAAQLRKNGYRTFATSANGLVGPAQMPVMRGFDDFKLVGDVNGGSSEDRINSLTEIDTRLALYHVRASPHTRAMAYYSAERLLPIFLAQIRAAKGRPYFGFVNLVDAHEPYLPDPSDYAPETSLPHNFEGDVIQRRLEAELRNPAAIPDPARRAYVEGKIKTARFARLVSVDLSPEALTIYHNRYNATVRELDSELKRFFAEAEADHLLDNTIVIITSDHGESFGEKDFITHMLNDLGDDESTHHVPLVILLPRLWPRIAQRIDRRVTLASLAPTIYDFASIDCSPYTDAFAGYPHSLAPMITSPPAHTGRAIPPPSAKQRLTHEAAERDKAMRSLGYIQ